MRIAWATPFTPESAIGRVSEQVATELIDRPGVEVDVWSPAGRGGRPGPLPARSLPADDGEAARALHGYDHVVYNLGNHAANHGQLADVSEVVPGTVVLHDVSLVHLRYERLLRQGPEVVRHTLSRWYGQAGQEAAEQALADAAAWPWAPGTVESFPLLGPTLSAARSVITHSRWAAGRVRQEYLGEVAVARLPHQPQAPGEPDDPLDWLQEGRLLVLQAGAMNPDKCIPQVVEGFARARLADRAQLVVCGDGTPATVAEVRGLARQLGVEQAVTVLGRVSEATLTALRRRADVATVLRHPSSEAASAVLVDSLSAGTAVLTVDAGCYAEVDPATVLHLDVPVVAGAVAHGLQLLVEDEGRRRQMQEAGRRHVAEHHGVQAYADVVLAQLAGAGAGPRRRQLATDLGAVAARLHAPPDGALVQALAETATELFGGRPRRLGPYGAG